MFSEFIRELGEKNITITFSKGKLQYSGPEQNIDQELISKLKQYKSKLLKQFWPKECPNMMPINTGGDLMPVSLLHAGPSNYPISEYLGNNRPFYGFFYIGSEGEKIRYKTLEAFASEYLRQLQNVVPEGPYILGGLSMGGHLAYEMAIQLQNQGHQVPLLIIIDSGLPAYEPPKQYKKLKQKIYFRTYELLKSIYYWFYNTLRQTIYELFTKFYENLPKNRRKAYIIWIYGKLIRKYKPTSEYKGEMLVFRASENLSRQKYMGWENVCKNITMVNFNGNHGAMYNDKESVDLIKTHIGDWINKVESKLNVSKIA